MHGRISLTSRREDGPVANGARPLDLRHAVDFFFRRWKLILTTAIAVAAVAFAVTMTLTPRYTATAQILLEPKKESIFGAESIIPELNLDAGNVDSQVSVIQSVTLLRRVVEKFDLGSDPEFGDDGKRGLRGLIRNLLAWVRGAPAPLATPPDQVSPAVLRAIENLRLAMNVERIGRTYVISVAVTSEDAAKAVRLSNAIADAFVVDRLDARYDAAKRASTWLAERIEGLRDQVRQSEEAVASFRQQHNLTVSSEGKVAVSEQQLAELNARLVSARADTAEKKAKFDQAEQVKKANGNLQTIPDVVRSGVISDLRKQEAEVTRKEADLVARYSDAHPSVVNARAEYRDIEHNIAAEVARIVANLKNDYDVAQSREDALQSELNALTGQGGGDGTIGVKLRELQRVNEANKTLFDNFLSRAKITQEQTAFEEREARIISPATMPEFPSFPKKVLILPIAMILGLGLGVGGAIALEMLNSGFTTPKEVEVMLGRPVLSSIPLLSESERKVEGRVESPIGFLLKKPLSRFAEQVRAVRIGVQMADVDDPAKVVLVTSSIPKEGKSTLAACLALSAAKAGQRTLLIDGDLRHPTTSNSFGLGNHLGLVDILTGAAQTDAALAAVGSIVVLPAGSSSQNPADLLGSARMKDLILQLRGFFDYVVIDSPPVAPVIDAKIIQRFANKIVYVVRWQSTPREVVIQYLDQLAPDRRLAGIAFNLVNERKSARYGSYAYYYGGTYRDYYQS